MEFVLHTGGPETADFIRQSFKKYLATLATDKERESANMIFEEYTQPRLLTYRAKSL